MGAGTREALEAFGSDLFAAPSGAMAPDDGLRIPLAGWLLYAGAALVAVALPLLIAPLDLAIVSGTYNPGYRPYEIFGFTASVATLGFLGRAVWERRSLAWRPALVSLLPVLLPAWVGLHYLHLITEFSGSSFDWRCYQEAASRVLAGAHPYGDCYLYPPLPAQALALGERMLAAAAPTLGWSESTSWGLLLYAHQCSQFFLIQIGVWLSYALGRRLGLSAFAAAGVVAALFLVNGPLLRTLRHLQVNLWVLDLTLVAILGAERRPKLAGACLALATHIKLHPVVLLGPWGLSRRWRPLVATLVALALVAAVQLAAGGALLWTSFFEFARDFPLGRAFRDNSIHSLAFNLIHVPGAWFGLTRPDVAPAVRVLAGAATVAALSWLGLRSLRREGLLGVQPRRFADPGWRLMGHSMDALAVPLLCAPLVWEHHYVMALPIAIFAAAAAGARRPLFVAAACTLIFALPTFDVFPASYHRLAGLLMLLGAVSPEAERRAER